MQAYDIIVLALLIMAAVWGARRGFVKQLASLLSIVLGYVVAVNFRESVTPLVDAPPPWNQFAAMLGLFVVTSLLIWVAFRFVNGTIERAGLTSFDTQLGGLFGLTKGFLVAMAVTMFAVVMLGDAQRDAVLGSYSGNQMARLIHRAHGLVPTEWQQKMEPYFQSVEEHPSFANQPEQAVFSDPFESPSPSDSGEFAEQLWRYEDPDFGAPPVGAAMSGAEERFGDLNGTQVPQARLQEPVFDR